MTQGGSGSPDPWWPLDRAAFDALSQSGDALLIVSRLSDPKDGVRLARAIHDASDRREEPFCHLACDGLPADILFSEIFGHAQEPAIGRFRAKQGLAELANGGTLCLLSVDHLPVELLLHVRHLVKHAELKASGTDARRVDVRVIAMVSVKKEERPARSVEFSEDFREGFTMISLGRDD